MSKLDNELVQILSKFVLDSSVRGGLEHKSELWNIRARRAKRNKWTQNMWGLSSWRMPKFVADTEEVTSSNLVTPTKKSQARDQVSGLFCYLSKLRTNPRCASMPHLDVRKGMPFWDWH